MSVATAKTKVDLSREFPNYYHAGIKPGEVEIAGGKFISVVGTGRPGNSEFQAAISALYSVAYGVKFALKAAGRDFKVAPLEGLYWAKAGMALSATAPEQMSWKLLVRVPSFVSDADVQRARQAAAHKAPDKPLPAVTLEELDEGRSVQVMHVGPYSAEPVSIQKMLDLMRQHELEPAGLHHEIYLSDPRRVPEARWRTIVRLPVRAATGSAG